MANGGRSIHAARALLGRHRRVVACALAVALAAGALAAPAGAGTRGAPTTQPPRSCAALSGKRLKARAPVKAVEQGNEAKAVAWVCVMPHGRVWRAGAASSETMDGGYSIGVEASAGRWLAIAFDDEVGIAGSTIDKVVNAATGKSYRYFSAFYGPGEPSEEVSLVRRTLLGPGGQLAIAVLVERDNAPLRVEVVGFTPGGARRVLDSAPGAQIPVASLTLNGTSVGWTDAGQARTATL